MNITGPVIIINPEWLDLSEERLELWDDCMCFPHLLVKVQRHKGTSNNSQFVTPAKAGVQ